MNKNIKDVLKGLSQPSYIVILILIIFIIVLISRIALIKPGQATDKTLVQTSAPASSTSVNTKKVSKTEKPAIISSEFETDLKFTFAEHPDITFNVTKVGVIDDPKGDYNYSAKGIKDPVLLTIDLSILNNSDEKLSANYLQVIYTEDTDSGRQMRIAPYYIHTSYETNPLTSMKVNPTFIIPRDQAEISLVTGVYPPIIYNSAEELLSRSTDGFLINFKQKKAWHPEG